MLNGIHMNILNPKGECSILSSSTVKVVSHRNMMQY